MPWTCAGGRGQEQKQQNTPWLPIPDHVVAMPSTTATSNLIHFSCTHFRWIVCVGLGGLEGSCGSFGQEWTMNSPVDGFSMAQVVLILRELPPSWHAAEVFTRPGALLEVSGTYRRGRESFRRSRGPPRVPLRKPGASWLFVLVRLSEDPANSLLPTT